MFLFFLAQQYLFFAQIKIIIIWMILRIGPAPPPPNYCTHAFFDQTNAHPTSLSTTSKMKEFSDPPDDTDHLISHRPTAWSCEGQWGHTMILLLSASVKCNQQPQHKQTEVHQHAFEFIFCCFPSLKRNFRQTGNHLHSSPLTWQAILRPGYKIARSELVEESYIMDSNGIWYVLQSYHGE